MGVSYLRAREAREAVSGVGDLAAVPGPSHLAHLRVAVSHSLYTYRALYTLRVVTKTQNPCRYYVSLRNYKTHLSLHTKKYVKSKQPIDIEFS